MAANILIVDDNYSFAEYAKMLIENLGHSATICFESDKALETARTEMPDLILVDASMPDVSGLEVIQQLKSDAQTAKIPILLCSMTKERSEVREALTAGAMDFLPKPLNREELRTRISDALGIK